MDHDTCMCSNPDKGKAEQILYSKSKTWVDHPLNSEGKLSLYFLFTLFSAYGTVSLAQVYNDFFSRRVQI